MNAIFTGFIGAGSSYPSFVRQATDHQRFTLEGRIEQHLNRGKKSIEVNMDDITPFLTTGKLSTW